MPTNAISSFAEALRESVADGTFLSLTLGKPADERSAPKAFVTPTLVKGEPRLQFVERFATKDVTSHYSTDEGIAKIAALLGTRYLSATARSGDSEFSVDHNRRLEARFTSRRAAVSAVKNIRESATAIDPTWPWLRDL